MLENLALRQQLSTLASRQRPSLSSTDRAFWVALHRLWPGWRRVLVTVQPDTVVKRQGVLTPLRHKNRPPRLRIQLPCFSCLPSSPAFRFCLSR